MGFSEAATRSLRYNNSLRRGINNGYFQSKNLGSSQISKGEMLEIDTSKADLIRRKRIFESVAIPLLMILLISLFGIGFLLS